MKFDSKSKFYIGIAVLLVALVIIYPFISDVGQFVKGSTKVTAVASKTVIPVVTEVTPVTTTETCTNVLDQYTNYDGNVSVWFSNTQAQSFIPTQNKLTKIDIYASAFNTTETVKIIPALANGYPDTSTILTSKTIIMNDIQGWKEFDIPDITVVPGNTYFIFFDTSDYSWGKASTYYPNGVYWFNVGIPGTTNDSQMDVLFRTYGSSCYCGNGICDSGEDINTCYQDCVKYTQASSSLYFINNALSYGKCASFCTNEINTNCVQTIKEGVYGSCAQTLVNGDYCVCTSSLVKLYSPASIQ